MPIKLILWDFGDTLADEGWMLTPMAGAPDWQRLYSERVGSTALGQLWNTGAISTDEVAAELASALEVEIDVVIAHMLACSRQVRFFSKVIAFVEECVAPQAIVTVNPDIFTKILVVLPSEVVGCCASARLRRTTEAAYCRALDRSKGPFGSITKSAASFDVARSYASSPGIGSPQAQATQGGRRSPKGLVCHAAANSEPARPSVRHVANAGGPSELYRAGLSRTAAWVAECVQGPASARHRRHHRLISEPNGLTTPPAGRYRYQMSGRLGRARS